jgi:hypothetical protein
MGNPIINPIDENSPVTQSTEKQTVRKSSIFGINVLIFFIYYVLTLILVTSNQDMFMYLLLLYIPHSILLFVFSVIQFFRKERRKAAILGFTAIVLFIIGFGACALPFFTGIIHIEI